MGMQAMLVTVFTCIASYYHYPIAKSAVLHSSHALYVDIY